MYQVVDCLKLMVDVEEEVRQQAQQELLTLASRSATISFFRLKEIIVKKMSLALSDSWTLPRPPPPLPPPAALFFCFVKKLPCDQ
jgi:hypothetical protein